MDEYCGYIRRKISQTQKTICCTISFISRLRIEKIIYDDRIYSCSYCGNVLNRKGHEGASQGGGNVPCLDRDCGYTDMHMRKNINNKT